MESHRMYCEKSFFVVVVDHILIYYPCLLVISIHFVLFCCVYQHSLNNDPTKGNRPRRNKERRCLLNKNTRKTKGLKRCHQKAMGCSGNEQKRVCVLQARLDLGVVCTTQAPKRIQTLCITAVTEICTVGLYYCALSINQSNVICHMHRRQQVQIISEMLTYGYFSNNAE